MLNNRESRIYKVTAVGSVVNALLVAFKFLAGIIGHSSAMIADAVHSLSDFVTDIIVILFVRISGKPQDRDHDYGHGKYETLATVIIGLILAGAGIALCVSGLIKVIGFFKGEVIPLPNGWALAAAILSIVLKEALFHYTRRVADVVNSSALRANAWHHRSDALTSVAALVGIGGAMLLGPRWTVLDPLAAVLVSAFIIKAAVGLMIPAMGELLEKSLSENDKALISSLIESTPGVVSFHRLRTRRIGSSAAIEFHIKMPGQTSLTDAHNVASEIEHRIRSRFGPATIVTIHMEPAS